MILSLNSVRRCLPALAAFGFATLCLSGCHSAFVQATVVNQTGKPIQLFEVDYPNASFGAGLLQPETPFRYRFKVLGEGQAKLSWTDAAEREHTSKGPALHEGQEGSLTIVISTDNASWDAKLHEAR